MIDVIKENIRHYDLLNSLNNGLINQEKMRKTDGKIHNQNRKRKRKLAAYNHKSGILMIIRS